MSPAPASTPMALLAGGVPLSLLFDLAMGPHSEELMTWEQMMPGQRTDEPF